LTMGRQFAARCFICTHYVSEQDRRSIHLRVAKGPPL